MPVKVRCRECKAQLTVPDAARGKSVKCKDCGQPIKVPMGEGDAPKKAAKAAKPAGSIEDDDFFGNLNLNQVEDENTRICQKCAAIVQDEDIECPSCGINLETGLLSAKQKKKKKNRGPDPDLFYKHAWGGSLAFLKENLGLALRLAIFWSVAFSLFFCTNYLSQWFDKIPLKVFFGGLAIVSAMASIGCFYQLGIAMIKMSMEEKTNLNRYVFDFFTDVSLGMKAVMWPFSLLGLAVLAIIAVVTPMLQFEFIVFDDLLGLPSAIVAGVMVLVALPTLPVAVCHMSAKYTYKAYLPNEMFRITFKNLKGVAFLWMLGIGLILPAVAALVPMAIFLEEILGVVQTVIFWVFSMCDIDTKEEARGFFYFVGFPFLALFVVSLTSFILGALIAFPAVMVLRATGLFCYYHQSYLEMGDRRVAMQPCGFWIRYLGYIVDLAVVAIFSGCVFAFFHLFKMFLNELGDFGMEDTVDKISMLVRSLLPIVYFTFTESGPGSGTLGMNAVGIQVVDENGKRIERGPAAIRFIIRSLSFSFFGIGLAMCPWDPEKRTLHDKYTKTKVVWRPEALGT